MINKIMIRGFFVILMLFSMVACIRTNPPSDPLPTKEQAILYLQLGIRYLEMDKLKVAKQHLEHAEEMDPANAAIKNVLGVLHERLNDYEQAEAYYQSAVNLDMANASIKNNYGRFLCEKGEYEHGMLLLNEALVMPLNNKKWLAYTNVGRCELKNGQPELAENDFRRALAENKSFAPALSEMQKISYKAGKFMSARAFLERFLAVARHTSETLWYAVQTERALGNERLVDEYTGRLFSLFPVSKEALQLKKVVEK